MKRVFSLVFVASLVACSSGEVSPSAVPPQPESPGAAMVVSPPLENDLADRVWSLEVMVDEAGTTAVRNLGMEPEQAWLLPCSTMNTPAGRVVALGSTYSSFKLTCMTDLADGRLTVRPSDATVATRKVAAGIETQEFPVGLVDGVLVTATSDAILARDEDGDVVWRRELDTWSWFGWSDTGTLVVYFDRQRNGELVPEFVALDPRTGRIVAVREMEPELVDLLNTPQEHRVPEALGAGRPKKRTLERDGYRIVADDSNFPFLTVEVFDAQDQEVWNFWHNGGKRNHRIAVTLLSDAIVAHMAPQPVSGSPIQTDVEAQVFDMETGELRARFSSVLCAESTRPPCGPAH